MPALQCIDTNSYGCTAAAECCDVNLEVPEKAVCIASDGLGRCSQCIASNNVVDPALNDGCSASSDCCSQVPCVRPAGSTVANGVCKDCVDKDQQGCTTSANCCSDPAGLKCQKPTALDAQGTCTSVSVAARAPPQPRLPARLPPPLCRTPTRLPRSQASCLMPSAPPWPLPLPQCIADLTFGCATVDDCCTNDGSLVCKKADPGDALGVCRPA